MIREETITTTTNGQPATNKADAVRAALAAGLTSPKEVVQYVKDNYGLEVSSNYVSVIKAGKQRQQPKRQGKGRTRAAGQPQTFSTATLLQVGDLNEPVPVPRQPGKLTPEDLLTLASLAERAGGVEALLEFLTGLKRLQ